jgi:hypothetical protein
MFPRVYIDAKRGRRRSAEWTRGRAAFESSYRTTLVEWDGADSLKADFIRREAGE